MQPSNGDHSAGTAAAVPRTGTLHAPGTDGLTPNVTGSRSMSLEERLKQAAMASSLSVGRAPTVGISHAGDAPAGAAAGQPQSGFPVPESPLSREAVKVERSSSGGSGDFSGLLRGDGSSGAAGGQGLDDIMKQARALTEADAALVRAAAGAPPGPAGAARGGSASALRPGRLLNASGLPSLRGIGETQSMPLNVRSLSLTTLQHAVVSVCILP